VVFWAFIRKWLGVLFFDLRAVTFILIAVFLGFQASQGQEIGLAMLPLSDELVVSANNIEWSWWGWNVAVPSAMIAIWIVLVWFWTYQTLHEKYATTKKSLTNPVISSNSWMLTILPTAYAFVALALIYFVIYGSVFKSSSGHYIFLFIIIQSLSLAITGFALFIALRLYIKSEKAAKQAKLNNMRVAPETTPARPGLWILRKIPKPLLIIPVIVFFLVAITYTFVPGELNPYIRTPTVVFLFLSIALSIVSALAIAADQVRLPLLFLAACWLAVGSYWNSDAQLNVLNNTIPPKMLTVDGMIEQKDNDLKEEETPLVIVATAGGGIRAAYWTASVLGRIQDNAPNFRKQVVGISGVSGGTLGAATWILSLTNADYHDGEPKWSHQQMVKLALDHDFLASALGGLFFTELLQNLILIPPKIYSPIWPFKDRGGLTEERIPDRGETLEAAWEVGWCRVIEIKGDCGDRTSKTHAVDNNRKKIGGFHKAIGDIWYRRNKLESDLPMLFANGTDTFTGKRVITAAVKTDGAFQDSFDFLDISKVDMRLATAVLNSARFTYVSPAGWIRSHATAKDGNEKPYYDELRIVDGGYFENYGAETAYELARRVLAKTNRKLVILQITSDPALQSELGDLQDPKKEDCGPFKPVHRSKPRPEEHWLFRYIPDIKTPIDGALTTREARGLLAAKRLRCLAKTKDKQVAYFHLPLKCMKNHTPPLGWLLAQATQEKIDKQLLIEAQTRKELDDLLKEIGGNKIKGDPPKEAWQPLQTCD